MAEPNEIPLYAHDASLTYDEEKALYIGSFSSDMAINIIEGIGELGVGRHMGLLLGAEFDEMVRDISQLEPSRGGRGIGGGGNSHHYYRTLTEEIIQLGEPAAQPHLQMPHEEGIGLIGDAGATLTKAIPEEEEEKGGSKSAPSAPEKPEKQINRHKLEEDGALAIGKWTASVLGVANGAKESMFEATVASVSLMFKDWYDGVTSLWDKKARQKIFAISFGGVLITATSRRGLRKKLTRQRNKRIQRIMMNVRAHKKEQDEASSTQNIGLDISNDVQRLRAKKKRAQALRPKKWENKVSPQGQMTGWRARSTNLRNRMRDKKTRARGLWVHRA